MLWPMESSETLQFPCKYPIKVVARAGPELRAQLDPIMVRHAGATALEQVTERPSAQANFVSITYLIEAQSETQIAGLFAELKLHNSIVMVL
jgi:putative lipoic acid-binding regulatory protein